jgi:hypothetical protein
VATLRVCRIEDLDASVVNEVRQKRARQYHRAHIAIQR